jgi:hypothetical protein
VSEAEDPAHEREPIRPSAKAVRALHIFVEQLKALSDLVHILGSHAELADSGNDVDLTAAVSLLDADQRRALEAVLSQVRKLPNSDTPGDLEQFGSLLRDQYGDDPALYEIARRCVLAVRVPSRLDAMTSALLPSVAGALEALVSALATCIYENQPRALLDGDEHAVPLEWLLDVSSVSEALGLVIDRRVSSLIMNRLNGWQKFFEKHAHVDIRQRADSWKFVRELFERRNVILHNGSMVTKRYELFALRESDKPGQVSPGSRLRSDRSYVLGALDHVGVIGAVVSLRVLRRLASDAETAQVAAGVGTDLLFSSGYLAAVSACAIAIELTDDVEIANLSRVNMWLAELALGRNGAEVREKVRTWQAQGDLSKGFELAAACLLDEDDRALALVDELVDTGALSHSALSTWPLFQGLRSRKRLALQDR